MCRRQQRLPPPAPPPPRHQQPRRARSTTHRQPMTADAAAAPIQQQITPAVHNHRMTMLNWRTLVALTVAASSGIILGTSSVTDLTHYDSDTPPKDTKNFPEEIESPGKAQEEVTGEDNLGVPLQWFHQERGRSRIDLTAPELISLSGYPVENYYITTEDGYILQLHRIPAGRLSHSCSSANRYGYIGSSQFDVKPKTMCQVSRPVVYLHHCLLCSSSDWVMNEPGKALAFMLADAGYDVWLGNSRGNTYSRNHTKLSPESKEFWEFSWYEMGVYDLPASIDYVLDQTNVRQLLYIGYSMGTTAFFTMMAERPEYSEKVHFMVGLGPVAYVHNMRGPFSAFAPFVTSIEAVMSMLGQYEFFPSMPLFDQLVATVCDDKSFSAVICHEILFFLTGANYKELNQEHLPVILAHTPAGTSLRTITHFLQQARSGNFQRYDYGPHINLKLYGQNYPPKIDLNRVTTPMALFSAKNDYLATPEDVSLLKSELSNIVMSHKVEDPNFTHLDFVWARNADKLVYRHVLKAMKKYGSLPVKK